MCKIIISDLRRAHSLVGGRLGMLYYCSDFGFINMLIYRIGARIRSSCFRRLGMHILIERFQSMFLSVHFPASVEVKSGLVIFHGYGLVIHPKTKIGKDCTLYHRVTLGQRYPGDLCPVLGHNVVVGAGAVVLGPVVVPDGAVIPANSVVTPSQNSWRIL
jgi:serine O-acetyltransferase